MIVSMSKGSFHDLWNYLKGGSKWQTSLKNVWRNAAAL